MAKQNNSNDMFKRFSSGEIEKITHDLTEFVNQLQSYNMQLGVENKEYNAILNKMNGITKTLGLSQNNMQEVIKYVREADKYLDNTTQKMYSLDDAMNKVSASSKKNNWQNLISNARQKEAKKIYEQERSALVEQFMKAGKNVNSSEFDAQFNENVTKALTKSSGKYDKASAVMSLAANTFNDAVKTFSTIFMNGVHEQRDIYNKTFTNIAVRTGLQSANAERTGYLDRLWDLPQELDKRGLFDNIAGSTVQEMWNTMATNGLGQEQIFANAIDTVLTNTIVPYLDTSSAAFQQYITWQPQLMKQVRGIGASTMDISGSAVFATEHLQEMVNELTPVSQQATEELGVQYAKTSGLYENLRQQGLSDSAIGELFYSAKAGTKDPLKALRSGNLDQQMAFMDVYANGDLTNIYDWASAGLRASLTNASWIGGSGNNRALQANIIAGNTSLGYGSMLELANKDLNLNSAISAAMQGGNNLDEYADAITESFTKGDMQTEQEKQTNYLENLSTKVAVIEGKIGAWSTVVENLVKGIGGLFATWIGGKIMGSLGGGGNSGGILGLLGGNAGTVASGGVGILGTLAGVAAGVIGGVALTELIAEGVGKAADAQRKQIESASSDAGERNKAESFGNAKVQTAIENFSRMEDTGSFGNALDNGFKRAGLFGLGAAFGWGDSYSAKEKAAWSSGDWKEYNIYKPLSAGINDLGGGDAATRAALAIIYALGLREVGYLSSDTMTSIFGGAVNLANDKDILTFIAAANKNLGLTASAMNGLGSWLVDEIGAPVDSHGNAWDGTWVDQYEEIIKANFNSLSDEEKGYIKEWQSHRHGLDYVPYDDYPALLHEGETVLTASTADELRLLIDEYRTTRQQSANLDALIQGQTNALVTEMERIISVIQNRDAFATNDNLDYVRNSMRTMRSTSSFNN